MSNLEGRPVHERLLIAAYIFGALSTLLGALAALGATVEKKDLKYPNINGPNPPTPNKDPTEGSKRYFEM
jgi:hypothetical protein